MTYFNHFKPTHHKKFDLLKTETVDGRCRHVHCQYTQRDSSTYRSNRTGSVRMSMACILAQPGEYNSTVHVRGDKAFCQVTVTTCSISTSSGTTTLVKCIRWRKILPSAKFSLPSHLLPHYPAPSTTLSVPTLLHHILPPLSLSFTFLLSQLWGLEKRNAVRYPVISPAGTGGLYSRVIVFLHFRQPKFRFYQVTDNTFAFPLYLLHTVSVTCSLVMHWKEAIFGMLEATARHVMVLCK